ncbi:hypothetical protein A0127_05520 [Thermococcus peptonophilus]|uniref:Uncharacterized protein n=2 Tax=Thermococcus peptonophilus TaxID=53952 RepID=A0A142CV62_9EURY|nr:hypothetical protein A0127_05520 [Thermococcus peptonophilus]
MSYVAAATDSEDTTSVYNAFWDILNREAMLVLEAQEGNTTAAQELITNSREGEKNAAQISALVWEALEELDSSGVKLYYTEEELRGMAQEIKQKGLPSETVKTLREQGWSDGEIQALQNYIIQNADNITGDFNMSEFLENFSTAFVKVGFKYAHYETFGLEKWKWGSTENFTGNLPQDVSINPLLAEEWVNFYKAYLERNSTELEESIEVLSSRTYALLTSHSSFKARAELLRNGSLILRHETVTGVDFYSNGFAVIKTSSDYDDWRNLKKVTVTDTYYWPAALRTYNLTRQVYVIVMAMNQGNDNPELWWILNQKVDELKEALKVYVSESVTEKPLKIKPSLPPISIEPPKQPIGTLSSSGGSLSTQSTSEAPTTLKPTEVERKTLDPYTQEGILNAGVSVIPVEVTDSFIQYQVVVSMKAKNNVVTDVRISVHGTGLSDSGEIGMIHPDDGEVDWTSSISDKVRGSNQVIVSGKVKITYTSNSGPTPNSIRDPPYPR